MVVVRSSFTLHILPLFLLLSVATAGTTTFNITNRCSYTLWPASSPGGGRKLDPGDSWSLEVPAGNGRVWARTGCSFDSAGNGSCQTGDCAGVLSCKGGGQPPNTLAEFSVGGGTVADFFDISLVDGFNVPMDFLPVQANRQGGKVCSKGPRCAANITSQCPSKLMAPGGCKGPCNATDACEPTDLAYFIRMCPDAYGFSQDSSSTTYTCPSGTNYQVIFCPPIDMSTPAPPMNSPTPTVTGPTPSNSSSLTKSRVLGVILGSVGGFIVFAVLVTFFAYKLRTRHRWELQEDEELGELQGMPMRFTFQQLEEATDQFREKLGEGGFGSVFEGKCGEERIAVKRLDGAGQGKREFLAEVQTIGSIHHINLVRLIGFCAEKSHRLLVYEYMPKGSLDRWIFYRHENNAPLDWSIRCKIIIDIAKGLSYLHEECMKRIAHLDVKPQNILLDENFNAKLSDFGLCKLIDRDKSQVITRMRGTPGYLAPEWLTSKITEKADVYMNPWPGDGATPEKCSAATLKAA
ncbi:hypothetical protein QOZ80_1BG0055910 [Eleusine coracana subsp. coracana]|nr:hypothetical protein QOZ80_1BG0055910 [Eleusine coracana subsp. coracana]